MSVAIFNNEIYDITEDVLETVKEVSYQSSVLGEILARRTYQLKDFNGKYNPERTGSIFNNNIWRGLPIVERDAQGLKVYEGEITNVFTRSNGQGDICFIESAHPLRFLLSIITERTDYDTTYRVNGDFAKGNDTIQVDTGTTEIIEPVLTSFADTFVPRYQIQLANPDAAATTEIRLDRALEKGVSDGDIVYLFQPIEIDIPAEIKRIFEIFVPSNVLGNGFDSLSSTESSANRKAIINIRREDNIQLKDYLAQLKDMGKYEVIQYSDGKIDLIQMLGWNGQTIHDEITASEIIDPETKPDMTRLINGYDLAYRVGDEVRLESATAATSVLIRWHSGTSKTDARSTRYQPIKAGPVNAAGYNLLYNNQAHASHIGDEVLDYFELPKKIVKCSVKPSKSDDINFRYDLQKGRQFLITVVQHRETIYDQEPAQVLQATWNEDRQLWTNVIFELINNPVPAI